MSSVLVMFAPFLLAGEPARTVEKPTLDKTGMVAVFGGDCRVKWTRSELLLDIDPNPPGTGGPGKARTRLVLTPYTAKRLAVALSTTLQRHEAEFGTVEMAETKGRTILPTLDPKAAVVYANWCRVTATPEELFLDFALNDNPFGATAKSLLLDRRVILTHARGKALTADLTKALQTFESEVGAIELDVRKRMKQKE
jgi:hypothetical protein